MRLLKRDNSGGLSLAEFIGSNIPPYAILSHTWTQTSKEVTFAAFTSGDYAHNLEYAESYEKIRKCGEQAKRDGLEYFWVDTCCINKESSAELSEAINSMYAWYRDADICYAFLSDIRHRALFTKSRWFTRGWTLQELLAPADVIFFDASWSMIGFKTSLMKTLSQHTGIDARAIHGEANLHEFSIAERMSWAASRHTTRVEDEAYCLMGLFDVNMPLIYGEGQRAFLRLQEELLRRFNDGSMFAYIARSAGLQSILNTTIARYESTPAQRLCSRERPISDEEPVYGTIGLFATSPSLFLRSKYYRMLHSLPSNASTTVVPRVRRNGHCISLYGMLWRPGHHRFPKTAIMTRLYEHIEEEYNLKFTLSSIYKLHLCEQKYDDWVVAFLGCRRHNGGLIGIVLQYDPERCTYSRIHYPSIIETVGSCYHENVVGCTVERIDIEADMLTFEHVAPSFFAQIGLLSTVTVRPTNFCAYGLQRISRYNPLREHLEYRSMEDPTIPHIFLTPNDDHDNESSLVCKWFTNASVLRITRLGEATGRASVLVPLSRGWSNKVELNESLHLKLQTQMRWALENGRRHKQCLLILSIEERNESTDGCPSGGAILDEGPYEAPPVSDDESS